MRVSHFDICVVGGGLVGLATARDLLIRRPDLRLVVLDKEERLGAHQSSHNSGVLHAGLYYAPGSLKARLCVQGKAALERYAVERGIPFERCGKVVVALTEEERPRLAELLRRGIANGVAGIRLVGRDELREIEPNVVGLEAIHSPATGIIDFRRVVEAYVADVRASGAQIRLGWEVRGLHRTTDGIVVDTGRGEVTATKVISCAGLWADRVARLGGGSTAGGSDEEQIVPFRGDYYTLAPNARGLVRALIYPVPDPRYPFLGVHFTRRIDGEVWAGPNAVLALAREGYRRRDIRIRELRETIAFPGFRRLARTHWRTGAAEVWRDVAKYAFVRELRRYVPAIRGSHLTFGPSGVRAQAVRGDGSLVDDFSLVETADILHVRNAPSPAATASLAIGAELASRAIQVFGLAERRRVLTGAASEAAAVGTATLPDRLEGGGAGDDRHTRTEASGRGDEHNDEDDASDRMPQGALHSTG